MTRPEKCNSSHSPVMISPFTSNINMSLTFFLAELRPTARQVIHMNDHANLQLFTPMHPWDDPNLYEPRRQQCATQFLQPCVRRIPCPIQRFVQVTKHVPHLLCPSVVLRELCIQAACHWRILKGARYVQDHERRKLVWATCCSVHQQARRKQRWSACEEVLLPATMLLTSLPLSVSTLLVWGGAALRIVQPNMHGDTSATLRLQPCRMSQRTASGHMPVRAAIKDKPCTTHR